MLMNLFTNLNMESRLIEITTDCLFGIKQQYHEHAVKYGTNLLLTLA